MRRISKADKIRWAQYAKRTTRKRLVRRRTRPAYGVRTSQREPALARAQPGLLEYYARRAGVTRGEGRERTRRKISCPEHFSFIDEPDDAIRVLNEFARACVAGSSEIRFDQRKSKHIDLCAASLFNCLAMDVKDRIQGLSIGGWMPKDQDAFDLVCATGLPKALGVLPAENDPPHFTHVTLRKGWRQIDRVDTHKALKTQELVTYIDECLLRFDFELSGDGRDYLCTLMSEVIDNCEEHSGREEWWVAAYLRQPKGASIGDCHITIFNFGRTIHESLQGLPEDAALRVGLQRLTKLHQPGFRRGRRWSEENLWTLFALQQGVSCKNDQPIGTEVGDQGQGTVALIEMFQLLGARKDGLDKPTMAIVSGRTHIRFDGRYEMKAARDGASRNLRKMITFNEAGTLEQPPDPDCVRELDRFFPGTIISLRFFLDAEHLAEVQDHGKHR